MTCFVGYHGSTSRVEKFSAQRRQRSEYGDGFYFTDDFATAEHYGPVVGRYEICFCRPLHAHQLTLGDILAERSGQALPSRLRDQGAWITHTAQALGYDGLVLTLASGQRYFVAFSPSQVRLVKEGPPPKIRTARAARGRIGGWTSAF